MMDEELQGYKFLGKKNILSDVLLMCIIAISRIDS